MKYKTKFIVNKMDCNAEKELISLKLLDNKNVLHLNFDLPNRLLEVIHFEDVQDIHKAISELKLDDNLESTEVFEGEISVDTKQKKLLIYVLIINFLFFLIEMFTGIISHSMGLIADSLDMLADSLVYFMSLLVIGKHISKKKIVAHASGYFQIVLAMYGLYIVVQRYLFSSDIPDFKTMIVISFFALIANVLCLKILQKESSNEAHMQASKIFTSNDILINIGVILSGIMVFLTGSLLPDLIIATIVFILVLFGAKRILSL